MDALERIAEAVLYEGYVLWPYRRSARKNQQRWTFGGVYPRSFCETTRSGDAYRIQAECLVVGPSPRVDVELRFLQVVDRRVAHVGTDGSLNFVDALIAGGENVLAWDEAVEHRVSNPGEISVTSSEEMEAVQGGVIIRSWKDLHGCVALDSERLQPDLFRVTAAFENTSTWEGRDRDAAQRRSFLSAHLVLRVSDGAFVSLTDPPLDLSADAAACHNIGLWPVLVGAEGERSTILASPIILYDYPQIAPESPGLLFDSSEIDQLLLLNTLALTDAEKAEVRGTDPRAREILDRAEAMTSHEFSGLHGVMTPLPLGEAASNERVRDTFQGLVSSPHPDPLPEGEGIPPDLLQGVEGIPPDLLQGVEGIPPESVTVNGTELRAGAQVRLHPHPGGDIFDLALDGRLAIVEAIEQDFDERVHLAVTLPDDPGRDLGMDRMPGHRFFFSPDEVEPVV